MAQGDERGIHDISPFRITKYAPHNRAALVGYTTSPTTLEPGSIGMGFHPTFVRIHPTDGDVLLEVGEDSAPTDPDVGSLRIISGNPEWIQIPFKSMLKIRSVSGTVNTSVVWAG